jgi:hypothetical protein
VVAAVVFGSTARGDINNWSDLDLPVVAPDLPADARVRLELLMRDAPPGLQPVGARRAGAAPPSRGPDRPGVRFGRRTET